jgi:hypothetical protein
MFAPVAERPSLNMSMLLVKTTNPLAQTYSPHFTRKSLPDWGGVVVGSGAVRGESVRVGGIKGCYWWKTV